MFFYPSSFEASRTFSVSQQTSSKAVTSDEKKMFITLVSSVSLALIVVYLTIKYYYSGFKRHGIPGPEPSFPFGNARKSILKKRNIVYDIDDVYQ